jgi:oligopeptidase B
VSCLETLHELGWSTPQLTAIEGRSAGGLLLGAVLNMRPDLFTVVLASAPYVDVLASMGDPTIPLVATDWAEFGNPNEDKYFSYMRSYSVPENVTKQAYPATLIVAGLHASRVQYW